MSKYDDKAQAFLDEHDLRLRTMQRGDRCPGSWIHIPMIGRNGVFPFLSWCDGTCSHGDRYRVTISRKGGGRLGFDFWNSVKDVQNGKEPTAYDVLACISGDVFCPETFKDFCGEYGYDKDSRKALTTFPLVDRFARRLRKFFNEAERNELGEIR